ncbi:type II toxin-antitoxin system HicB family antitoxin [Longimicrobium sp.]|jgi:predicted RNase H-like HicB family nuclease|uniref:type II toxin-antitoxin system HicB family antitoxin n=1 Tax=Longimicrobium sp. TaxID=2029185 RepID=UPI002EDB7E17
MPMKPVFEKTPTGYIAWVDGLPGALTQGDSLEEIRDSLADAVLLVLETRRMMGAIDAGGLWPPARMSDPLPDHFDAGDHGWIRQPFILRLDHFLVLNG